ncbi:MAG: hypothetical protein JXK07_14560 [Spirochaetes bacterium]|nr:hypothetical protein [Spirochaetota bacterium]MBN2770216.1 hypothetical protein [Spirochaetota bacterium]
MYLNLLRFVILPGLIILLGSVSAFCDMQRGGYVLGSFSPIGLSPGNRVLYDYEPKGSVDASTESDITSLMDYSLEAGYFHGLLMADARFYSTSVDNQKIEYSEYFRDETISYKINTLDVRAGLRLSDLGNSSFTYPYIGYRYFSYSSDYLDTKLKGHGFTVGLTGFYTFFPRFDFEPALYVNAYLGNYRFTDLESDMTSDFERSKSIAAGATFGAGVHYEPYNVTMLAIVRGSIDQISHDAKADDGWVECGIRHTGFYAGLAVMYQRYNFKYNR